MTDLLLGILALIPGVNFLIGAALIIRSFKFKVVKKELFQKYDSIEKANIELERLNSMYQNDENLHQNEIASLEKKIEKLKEEIQNLKKEYDDIQADIIYEYTNTKDYSDVTSEDIKNDLSLLKLKEKELVKNKDAFNKSKNLDSKKIINARFKQISKCFSAETTDILNKLTLANTDASRNKIIKSFETINKAFEIDGVQLDEDFLKIKLEELSINNELQKKIEEEKIARQEQREILREEEKVRREIEREKAKIEKEEKQFNNEIAKLMGYMQKTGNDVEKQLYVDKIKELEEKLSLLEKDKKNVFDREQNTRAGYVYIISNIGSFGENIYKIGVTRRLEPMDRIKELSSASVPFGFDVHAMIFSEDAPGLETILHTHFRNQAVNKVNSRKEFFNVNLDEVKELVLKHHNNTVDFTMDPEAYEYKESLKLKA